MTEDEAVTSGNTLGHAVKALREAKGWTQDGLARRAKIQTSTIQNIESGRVKRPNTLPHIADALGVTVEDLIEGPAGATDNPYTDPTERGIWEATDLSEDERRSWINLLRERRRTTG